MQQVTLSFPLVLQLWFGYFLANGSATHPIISSELHLKLSRQKWNDDFCPFRSSGNAAPSFRGKYWGGDERREEGTALLSPSSLCTTAKREPARVYTPSPFPSPR